jgi:hypothetical protein
MKQKFPVGGPRQPVYDFLTRLGCTMSSRSDKTWTLPDGREVSIFGAGSMAKLGAREFPLDELGDYINSSFVSYGTYRSE